MVGLYGATRTDALLNGGTSSPLSQVAAMAGAACSRSTAAWPSATRTRPWDLNPCNLENANKVVRSINDLVAPYRARLPNLKYIVLLGTDQVDPYWRQQDLTNSAPEVDEASDLFFTTRGLTKGNSIYATAAQNSILTDGAYGHFMPHQLARPRHPAAADQRLAHGRDARGHQRAAEPVPERERRAQPALGADDRRLVLRGRRAGGRPRARGAVPGRARQRSLSSGDAAPWTRRRR